MKTDKFVVQSNFRLEVVLGGPNSAKGLLLGNICIKLPKSDSQVDGLYPPAISSVTLIFAILKMLIREQQWERDYFTILIS